jgi:hypothetical protein
MTAQNLFGDQSMQPTAQKIDQLHVTHDTLTSRGGLTFLVKYVEAIGILTLLAEQICEDQEERQRSIVAAQKQQWAEHRQAKEAALGRPMRRVRVKPR